MVVYRNSPEVFNSPFTTQLPPTTSSILVVLTCLGVWDSSLGWFVRNQRRRYRVNFSAVFSYSKLHIRRSVRILIF